MLAKPHLVPINHVPSVMGLRTKKLSKLANMKLDAHYSMRSVDDTILAQAAAPADIWGGSGAGRDSFPGGARHQCA